MTSMMGCSDLYDESIKSIRVKDITESFQDYRKPSLFIGTCFCDWKCCREANISNEVCQNYRINKQEDIEISFDEILDMFRGNILTEAIIIGGLEPFMQIAEVYNLIKYLRKFINDDIVIYTGYYPEELSNQSLEDFAELGNIIIKFGRYKPDSKERYDDVLGVTLISENQFAVKY